MNLLLLNFNNYFNRMAIKLDTVNEYITKSNHYTLIPNINFNPGDDVYTQQIVNFNETWRPDYMLVLDGDDIFSRWYIIEFERTRNGQYRLYLKRDTIIDNYLQVTTAPMYIEKATVNDADPAIFNKEDLEVSQIKTSETKLISSKDFPCIVGYVERRPNDDTTDNDIQVDIPISTSEPDYTYRPIAEGTYRRFYPETGVGIAVCNPEDNDMAFISATNKLYPRVDTFTNQYGGLACYFSTGNQPNPRPSVYPYILSDGMYSEDEDNYIDEDDRNSYNSFVSFVQSKKATVESLATQYISNYNPTDVYADYNGKVVKDGSSYYRIDVAVGINWECIRIPQQSGLDVQLKQWTGLPWATAGDYDFTIFSDVVTYTVTYTYIGTHLETNWNVTIPKSSDRVSCKDAIYDMFVIPFTDDLDMDISSSSSILTDKEVSIQIGMAIARKLGSKLFDLQLVPYCPLPDIYLSESDHISMNAPKTIVKTGGGNNAYCIYWSDRCTFTRNINQQVRVKYNTKESNCLDMYRIVSPNGNGIFEFSPAMNKGVDYFKVDCMYQPSNPYIHIAPNFKAQYGKDFNDKRGLICGGDFSLPHIIDKWVEYQNSNKYYQAIFDRNIENMEFNNKWQLAESITNATVGSIASGVGLGVLTGNVGAGIASGVGSALGGVADIAHTIASQKENLDYTKDLYNLNLKTIQAMPTSISKMNILDPNYKLVPVLEYYTCTNTEREAFRNKIKYNGMKVGRIGTINEFQQSEPTYIKGQLIRLEGTDNDFHEVNDIASELYKGVFI